MRLFRSIVIPLAVQALIASLLIGCLLVALTYFGQQRASAEQDRERIAAFATAAAEASRAGLPLDQLVRDTALAQPALNGRLVLFGPDNTRIAGTISGATTSAEAAVVVDGRRVATARLVGRPSLTGSDRTRLMIQYLGIGGIVLLMLAGLLAAAFSLARRFAGPPLELFRLSREVVHGDHEVVIDDDHDGPAEIVATMRNLRRIASQFSRLEAARRTWLVSIADELKRPAENMGEHFIALCEQEPPLSPDLLAVIEEDARRLIQMSDDLSTVALADLGRLSVTFAPADARTFIKHAIYVHEHRARLQGIRLQIAELPEEPVSVQWDSPRIGQLLGALIDNSLRYTPENGQIILGLESARDAWRLIVDDSAPGVDVMLAQRLFEPFYRSADRAEESAPSGLGLATARAIVDAHHGRIEASRSPIGGLRVTVVLPAHPVVE